MPVPEAEAAWFLACNVALRPEGFAVMPAAPMPPAALGAVIAVIGGRARHPPRVALAALAAAPRPATLAGVRLLPAGRLGEGLLAVREAAAMGAAVPAHHGALWDGRFRLDAAADPPDGLMIGAVGRAASRLRDASELPAAVLRTLPALWEGDRLSAVPHLGWPDPACCARLTLSFAPARPAAPAPVPPSRS